MRPQLNPGFEFFAPLSGGLLVVTTLPAEEMLARHVDKDWTLCDALAFAVLDARHVSRAFTFDGHFRQYGDFGPWGSVEV